MAACQATANVAAIELARAKDMPSPVWRQGAIGCLRPKPEILCTGLGAALPMHESRVAKMSFDSRNDSVRGLYAAKMRC